MFDAQYFDWTQKRIKGIVDFYGHKFLFQKKVLDLGCGHADISGALHRLGAEITAVDARQEHLKIVNKKFPGIKTVKLDLDAAWPFYGKHYDIILDLDMINHVHDYEQHIKRICSATNHLVLETAVCDSLDPYKNISIIENKSSQLLSVNGNGCMPSAAAIERVILECGFNFRRQDNCKYNSVNYFYDWVEKNNDIADPNKRRLWFAVRNTNTVQFTNINNSPPIILSNDDKTIQNSLTPAIYSPITCMPTPQQIKNFPAQSPILFNFKPLTNEVNKSLTDLKVAVCLSGHMRTFQKTGPAIVENLIKPSNADVFIHTWDSLGFDPGRGDQNSAEMKTKDYLDKITDIFNPKNIIIENFFPQEKSKYVDRVIETRDPSNVLGMFYKIKKCNELKQNYEDENNFIYDVVIRCRPDLNLDTKINTSDFLNLDSLYLPKYDFHLGFNDKFAFGTSKIMDVYSLCYDYISSYYDMGCIFNGEAIMKYHINYFKIPLKRCDIQYTIHRIDGFKFSNT